MGHARVAGPLPEAHQRHLNHAQTALFSLTMGLAVPLVFQHLEATFHARPAVVGLVAAAFGGVQVLVRVPLGYVIDERGERGVLTASWGLTAVAGAGLWWADDLYVVAIAFAVFGLAVGAFWVASNTLAARLAPPGQLARSMNSYMVAVGLGFVVGPLLSGIADLVGFRWALASLVPLAVAGAWLATGIVAPPPGRSAALEGPTDRSAFWLGLASAFYLGLLLGTSDAFIPVHLRIAGFTAVGVGVFVAGREVSNLLARLGTRSVVRDRTAALFLAGAVLLEAAGLVVFPRSTAWLTLAVSALLMGVGIGLVGPASLTVTARGGRPGAAGRAMGGWGTAFGLGALVGPGVLGPVGDLFGLVRIFDAVAVVSLGLAGWGLWHQLTPRGR